MEGFLQYAPAAAVTVVLMEMVLAIMPEGAMKSMGKMAAGICILLMLLTPVRSCAPEEDALRFEESGDAYTVEQEKSYDDIIMDVYNREMENMD